LVRVVPYSIRGLRCLIVLSAIPILRAVCLPNRGPSMTILRRGITGFGIIETVDFSKFKKAVYSSAQASGASVLSVTRPSFITPNFYQADIKVGERLLSILCNQTFPVVALVESPIAMDTVRPLDLTAITDPIRELGFEIAAATELDREITSEDMAVLGEDERGEAKYWKPNRISQLVFNWWD
jgi:hypothetical protein